MTNDRGTNANHFPDPQRYVRGLLHFKTTLDRIQFHERQHEACLGGGQVLEALQQRGVIDDMMVSDAKAHPVLRAAVMQFVERAADSAVFAGMEYDHHGFAKFNAAHQAAFESYYELVVQAFLDYASLSPSARAHKFGAQPADYEVDVGVVLKQVNSHQISGRELAQILAGD